MNTAGWKVPSRALAIICAALLVPGEFPVYAQDPTGPPPPPAEKLLSAEQLQSLVAPIALYPDPLLAQVLAACTYPLEAVEADRWVQSNKSLQGEQLVQAAAQQDWEPSIQALVVFPDVLNRISVNLKWSTALGNAFLGQEEAVMGAVQAMRRAALQAGNLQSNSQQNVTGESGNIIVIQPANPQVIYVPVYNPTVIYGALPYPYPAMAYPPPPSNGAIVGAGLISFGAGIALGAAFRGCCGPSYGWGWGCNWHGGSVTINNNFFGRYGYATPYRGAAGVGAWAHNPYYRGAVPYSSAAVAGRYAAAAGVRTPYGAAGAVKTPYGAAGAVKTPYGSAAAVATPRGTAARTTTQTPYGSTAKTTTPYGSAARATTANGSAAAVSTPYGSAAGVKTPGGTTVKTQNGTYSSGSRPPGSGEYAGSHNMGSAQQARPSAFGSAGGAAATRANSNRGAASMRGGGGGRRR
jgi:hypothetical protein